jgi:hypothetical protein
MPQGMATSVTGTMAAPFDHTGMGRPSPPGSTTTDKDKGRSRGSKGCSFAEAATVLLKSLKSYHHAAVMPTGRKKYQK